MSNTLTKGDEWCAQSKGDLFTAPAVPCGTHESLARLQPARGCRAGGALSQNLVWQRSRSVNKPGLGLPF